MKMHTSYTWIATLALVNAAACGDADDPIVEPAALERLEGAIGSLEAGTGATTSHLVVVWDNYMRNGDLMFIQPLGAVDVSSLPASFAVDLVEEPTDEALNQLGAEGGDALLGVAYVAVLDVREASEQEPRGLSATHALLYAKNLGAAARETLGEKLLTNPEALVEGFNLARFVCSGDDALYDKLAVVAAEPVSIISLTEAEQGCVDIH